MNIQRLRYLREIARRNLNLTAAAQALHTSQPGVSRQIIELEEELGIQIFVRKGRRLVDITEPGQRVLEITNRLLFELDNLSQVAAEHENEAIGTLIIGTTHTQARYKLPNILQQFRQDYPRVTIKIKQGTPEQIAHWLREGQADLGMASESLHGAQGLSSKAWYQWSHVVVTPSDHLLQQRFSTRPQDIKLEDIAAFPLLTYDTAFAGRTEINHAFAQKGLSPEVAISALDADVIKTYIRARMGVGLLAQMAYDPQTDSGLVAISCAHLFSPRTAYLAIANRRIQRSYVYALLDLAIGKAEVLDLRAQALAQ